MATTLKSLARGAFATSSGTLYTVPASTTAIVTNITICNATASNQTFNLSFQGSEVFYESSLLPNQTAVIDMKQTLATANIITGYASSTSVKYHISGAEIA